MEKLFDLYDSRKRGKLKRNELHSIMGKTGVPMDDIDSIFDQYAVVEDALVVTPHATAYRCAAYRFLRARVALPLN